MGLLRKKKKKKDCYWESSRGPSGQICQNREYVKTHSPICDKKTPEKKKDCDYYTESYR